MLLNQKIDYVRKHLGWSKKRLAAELGVTQSYITQLTKGEVGISEASLLRLANITGVSIDFFLRDDIHPFDIGGSLAGKDLPRPEQGDYIRVDLDKQAAELGLTQEEALRALRFAAEMKKSQ